MKIVPVIKDKLDVITYEVLKRITLLNIARVIAKK
jgi:hypothetical protein